MSNVLPLSDVGSVDSDDVSESLDDWEILEFVGIDDNLSWFFMVGWVNDLEDTLEKFLVVLGENELVWESSINNDTIEVGGGVTREGGVGNLGVFVFGGWLRWASSCGFWHF